MRKVFAAKRGPGRVATLFAVALVTAPLSLTNRAQAQPAPAPTASATPSSQAQPVPAPTSSETPSAAPRRRAPHSQGLRSLRRLSRVVEQNW